jgi:hypothetical protein
MVMSGATVIFSLRDALKSYMKMCFKCSFVLLDSLISWALKLLMVVVSGVQWCDSHFPIER